MNWTNLGREVTEILDVPYNDRRDKGYQAVRAVFKAIVGALNRGETVEVFGFGSFKVINQPNRRQLVTKQYGGTWHGKVNREWIMLPPKRVVFTPSPSLRKFVNDDYHDSGD